ncbi:hypothetical protein D3C86_1391130 [compost metagenome]
MVGFRALSLIAGLLVALMASPAWATQAPQPVQALSSAGVPVGAALTDPSGNPYRDAAGKPVVVTGSKTETAQATALSLSNTLKVGMADLLGYAKSLGISLPLVMNGTLTTVTRSDGGVERVFAAKGENGDTYVFLADQTGPNVFGIRIANVHPNGMGEILTAHGLNGNFTNPPGYLSEEARRNYWLTTQTAQVFEIAPSRPQAPAEATLAVRGARAGGATYASDFAVGEKPLTLSGSQKQAAFARTR